MTWEQLIEIGMKQYYFTKLNGLTVVSAPKERCHFSLLGEDK